MRNLTIGLVLLAAACTSAEDRANAARWAELEGQQAQIIRAAGGKCDALSALDDWYAKNQSEVKRLSPWWHGLSSKQKDRMMKSEPVHTDAFRERIKLTIMCGFCPWQDRRKPSDPN
jgi:hypothetical protein